MKAWKPVLAAIVAALIAFFFPLPYYISYPGDATSIEDIVTVESGEKEKGELFMLTVAQRRATPYFLVESWVRPFTETSNVSDYLYDGESEEQYETRLELYMEEAQHAATIAGYELAKKDVEIDFEGIYVSAVIPDGPAAGKMKAGDVITRLEGETVTTLSDFLDRVTSREAGDVVEVMFKRGKVTKKTDIAVGRLDPSSKRVGLGIYEPIEMKDVKTTPDIEFDLEGVGGPSAGMMFTLEIYDQLTPGDLAKGHLIAGTGTIEDGGKVGPIGGAWQKVAAADEAGAEIMFVPSGDNFKEAKPSLKELGTSMKLVPIKTVQDALDYLESLPVK